MDVVFFFCHDDRLWQGQIGRLQKNQVEYHLPLRDSREKKPCRLASSSAVLGCSEKTAEHLVP